MSAFLDNIINNKNQTIEAKIVFVDVVSYSKRRSQAQAMVINDLIDCLTVARQETAKHYLDYCEKNSVSFLEDVIFLPTGDGAAVCFPFEGLHDVHLFFAKELHKEVVSRRIQKPCEKYEENNWCNCHSNFSLTVGVAQGKCIMYRDVNSRYNIAGNAINMAARVMSKADGDQILFSDDAYWQLIDLVDDAHMDEKFRRYNDVRIKHGEKISLYQYIGQEDFISSEPPEVLEFSERSEKMRRNLEDMGFPKFPEPDSIDKDTLIKMMAGMEEMFTEMTNAPVEIDSDDK
ncbi:MAG: hypothetical protein NXI27_31115 [Alphaproteobacteria bacterium]|nr:hypothetical protein [Alphaproteobacteria bacterium]